MHKAKNTEKNETKGKNNKTSNNSNKIIIFNSQSFVNENARITYIESDDNSNEYLIKKKEPILFDIEKYENFISEKQFILSLQKDKTDKVNLKKYYFNNTEYFCQYHLNGYLYINFKKIIMNFLDLNAFCQISQSNKVLKISYKSERNFNLFIYHIFSIQK